MLSYLIVFLIMVVLLSLFALGAKRFARGRLTLGGNGGTGRSRQPRLGIVDIYELDRQRQLILLRRDNTEHLLLVGGPNDVVVERNIVRAGAARVSAELADRSEAEGPEAPLPLPAGTEPAPLPPPFPEPELPRPPEPERIAAAFAPVPRRDDSAQGSLAQENLTQENLAPQPEPARPSSRFNASRRVEPPSLRAARQAPPPLETPPEAPPFTVPVPPVVPVPPPMPEPVLPPEPAPAPAGTRGAEPRNVDAAILNDMARQLEEALRRPSSAVAPARPATPVASPSPEPAPAPPEPAPPPPPPPPPEPEPVPEPAPPPPPEPPPPPPEPEPAPPPPPEPEPAPPPPPEPPPAPPPPPEEPAPTSKPPSVQNPFSVEEIEAEFARLLGRPLDKR
ncbi:hypothetical protein [Methylobacterium frigidaeris]|uniref:hypothetical protein n=1 Tax=Methylobacterium frigidaeris TaxID=2038277 RepID=UPI000D0AB690|nr:hypothetical protein [Methylobacterium frigidaeris]